MSAHSAALPAGSPSASPSGAASGGLFTAYGLRALGQGAYAMAQSEMRKLRHDHLDILTRSVQPLCGCSSSARHSATRVR